MTDFAGKSVIVTGAASGIGAATVRRFIADGASVLVVDLNGEGLRSVLAPLPSARLVAKCEAMLTDLMLSGMAPSRSSVPASWPARS